MKLKIDTKKSAEAVSIALQKTTELGKKAVGSVQQSAKALSDKSRADAYLRRMEKYNPVFLEQYESEEFHTPNMIIIVDDAVRRGIDVCEGAIGWLSKEKVGKTDEIEVFHLYDEVAKEAEKIGLRFVPAAICDAAYYVDAYDSTRFIKVDCIFDITHNERLEELAHIATCLGAKRCVVEIKETTIEKQVENKKASISEGLQTKFGRMSSNESAEKKLERKGKSRREGRIETVCEGSGRLKRPELKWFTHDTGIRNLIDMCYSGNNKFKQKTLKLSGSSAATMSMKAAYAIDATVGKLGGGAGASTMESQLVTERETELFFTIEF